MRIQGMRVLGPASEVGGRGVLLERSRGLTAGGSRFAGHWPREADLGIGR
jgi:hypothetical protein